MNWIQKTITGLLFLTSIFTTNAQDAVVSGGDQLNGNSGSISYSIGQPFSRYTEDGNISISEGVQKAVDVKLLTTSEDPFGVIMNVTTFPNPFSEQLTLIIESDWYEGLYYTLYSISGQIISSSSLEASSTDIPTSDLQPATYFLSVSNLEGVIKTFKITKQ